MIRLQRGKRAKGGLETYVITTIYNNIDCEVGEILEIIQRLNENCRVKGGGEKENEGKPVHLTEL